jgi:hypothetical protein
MTKFYELKLRVPLGNAPEDEWKIGAQITEITDPISEALAKLGGVVTSRVGIVRPEGAKKPGPKPAAHAEA